MSQKHGNIQGEPIINELTINFFLFIVMFILSDTIY